MTIDEARKIVNEYEYKSILSEDEEFMLTEAFNYLIEETKDYQWMERLGGYYYGKKDFDLALKYYEMADSFGDPWAPEGLGYIWYYGRTGVKDYEKAFNYYQRAAENGFMRSAVKIADMYKNGYYVEKDNDKYVSMIEDLYNKCKDFFEWDNIDIIVRLARIRKDQSRNEEAIDLFLRAKSMLEYSGFREHPSRNSEHPDRT